MSTLNSPTKIAEEIQNITSSSSAEARNRRGRAHRLRNWVESHKGQDDLEKLIEEAEGLEEEAVQIEQAAAEQIRDLEELQSQY